MAEEKPAEMIKSGGLVEVENIENDLELEGNAKYAVDQHNVENPQACLSFKKLLKAKKQLVSGWLYHLVLEAEGPEGNKTYAAKVWTKPWEEGFIQLKDFKLQDSPGD